MFDHVTVRASDREASERFYDLVLAALELQQSRRGAPFAEWGDFSLTEATAAIPATRRLHVAFFTPSRGAVDEFWRLGTEAGYRDDGAPGRRPEYSAEYYGAFLLDPDGNSVEAVNRSVAKRTGAIDHVWVRVADLAASRSFYATIAPYVGCRVVFESSERVRFAAEQGSFSLVRGEPTEQLHWAFCAADNATVVAFHRAATAAGYRDNGGPGERPVYHDGYYGAFVLDPDGNNVELVNHNR